ncbi:hypothetical protein [Amycolatopsis sp.]|uniref:hypothetical protein n=1 Tax=Amycolatopsis sp. TaxID=37632 RepID=UPI002DFBDBB3|nr:hypothetical protein [Amycolatopsis sp.]
MVGARFSPGAGDTAPLQRVGGPAPQIKPKLTPLKGAGLLGIAVVSGLLWWLIRHEEPAAPVAQQPANTGQFQFTLAEGPEVSTDCAKKSYNKTQDFFGKNPCRRLSRALYTTTAGGTKALVSVVLVTMPDAGKATALKALTDENDTGNISDMVRDKTAKIPGQPALADGEYESHVIGNEVTIVLANFFNGHKDTTLINKVAVDAIRLSSNLAK